MNATAAPLPAHSRSLPESILHRIDWQIIRRLDGLLQGEYRTLFYGDGLDFADLREYQLQDDIRHIDWNVTARTDSLHVREFLEEREVAAWFLLDLSPSMLFGPAERPKQTVLVDLVATLARLLTRKGNRVGGILYNNRLLGTIPPLAGRNQVLRLTRELLREQAHPPGKTTDLGELLRAGLNTFRRRSLVFVISDFLVEPGWERSLSLLSQRHEVVAIRLWDRRELELPDAGLLVVEDAETGEYLTVDTSDPEFRRRFLAAGQEREAALQSALRSAGVDLYAFATDDDLVTSLVKMAGLRKHRGRR